MNERIALSKVWFTYGICSVLTLQPALANVVIDGSSGNTSKSQAGNGVEVINIATPNSKGLSHNKYQQFNVDKQGLILNNSTEQLAQSQLGGILQNNPNLTGKAASVILNEVTGATRSKLEGYTEVFGQQANVILANPYGITCDGCGFINTPRVTLSTGIPQIESGEVAGFDVSEGSVNIEGLGLDATRQTYFDIISRTAEINANIHANELAVITGQNSVTYQTNQVSKKTPSPQQNKPTVAIDSSSLGGMYAGRIALVATEEGVGVNVGNLVSSVGDIVLTADGKVQLASAQSAQNIEIVSHQDVELTSQQIAQEQLAVSSENLSLNQTTATAGDLVALNVNGNITARDSQLLSGIKANNQINANAKLSVKAQDYTSSDSDIASKGNISGHLSSLNLDSKSTVAASDISLTQVHTIENDGNINVDSQLEMSGEQINLIGTGVMAAETVQIEADSASIDTQITANNLSAQAESTLVIGQQASLKSTTNTILDAERLVQKGQMTSNGDISLEAKTLNHEGSTSADRIAINSAWLIHQGQFIADQSMVITATEVSLAGHTQVQQTLDVTADTVAVTGILEATQLDLVSASSVNIDSPAQLNAINQLSIETSGLINKGAVQSGNELSIEADSIQQQGILTSAGDLQLDTGAIDIQSDIEAQGMLNLSASSINNYAQVITGQNLNVSAQELTNSGVLMATGDNTISLSRNVIQHSSGMVSGQTVSLSAAHIDNAGTLQALDNLNLTASSLTNSGALIALGHLTATFSGDMNNQGLLYAGSDAALYTDTLNNTSDIVVGHDLLIAKDTAKQKNSSVTNSSGTIESLGGDIEIYTSTLTNKRSTLDIQNLITVDNRAYFTPMFIANDTQYEPEHHRTHEAKQNSNGHNNRDYYYFHIDGGREFTVEALREGQKLVQASAPSRIVASGDITINAETVINETSNIAGQNVAIDAKALSNVGYLFSTYTTYYDYVLESWGGSSSSGRWYDFVFKREDVRKVKTGTSGQLNAAITASHDLTLNVANTLNNSTIQANATAVQPTQSAFELKATPSTSVSAPSITFASVNDVAFPSFTFPSTPTGLFVSSPDPQGQYLIETNPLLTNMGDFLGSEYFMSQVNFNPEADVKFLGDAFYDSRIISQAIFEQTGKQYLNREVGSQLEQMQQLIDAAASQKSALNLTAGIALSPAQVSSLTQDILWYEEIDVNGQTVLAPKLYLAQITVDNLSRGAQVVGDNISIDAGDITNSGSLSAGNLLNLQSANSITNVGGRIAGDGDVSLRATQDIINLSGDIRGDSVSLDATKGNIVNETRVTTTTASLGNNRGTFTDVGKTASISATGSLTLNAGNNIENRAATINTEGDAELTAGQDVIVASKEDTHGYDITARKWREGESKTDQISAAVTAGGALAMSVGQNIDVTASQVQAGDSLSLDAGNDVKVQTALNKQSDHLYRSKYTEINRSLTHQGSSLIGNTVSIESNNDLVVSGSHISATESVDLMAKGDVNILAVNDSDYHYDKTTKKQSFGRKKTTINESYHETVKGSSIQAGENINITAQQNEFVSTVGGDSEIRLIGSNLDAGGNVDMAADGDITLAAQSYKEFERHETIKKGFGGLSGRNKGSIDDATLLNSSYLINAGDTNLTSGSSIGVIASEVVTDGNVNLQALDDVLIAAGDVLSQSQQWDEKTSFLSGGHLFELEKKRQGEESSTAQASAIQSGRNLTVNSGSVKVIGSELNAGQNADIIADTGSVEILAAKETKKTFESEEKLAISIGEGSLKGISFDDGQLKISLGEASYDKVEQQSEALEHKSSIVTANTDLSIQSESDILVKGSVLTADGNNSQSGDLRLAAKDNVIIKEAENTFQQQRDEIHGKAEVSFVIQHQAIEVVKAAESLKESTENLKQAKKEYQQYKDNLEALTQTLKALEQDYKVKKPGVLYEDVEELRDLLSEVKSDEEWYIAGITLATVDVASKTTLLVQQTNAAANSIGTNGFDAGLHLDIEASKTGTSTEQTSSLASNLSGQNIAITAGSKDTNQATVQGSIVQAQDSLSLEANEINILASVDTQKSKTKTESGNISASMTVHGSSLGMNVNAGLNTNNSKSSSITHNNSQLTADTISITSQNDTNIKGANVNADSELVANIGGDLNIASVQNRQSSSNQGAGFSAGMSFDSSGAASGMNGGLNASSGRIRTKDTLQTTLTSGGTADVIVANNTDLKGALVATVDDQGRDLGNLNLTTDTLTFVDLTNSHYEQNKNTGINSSVGVKNGGIDSTYNSTSLQHTNTSGYSKSKALATVGEGVLTLADSEHSDDTTVLNRDTQNTEKDLFTVDRKQGDFDVTIDHRLLTEDGRKAIAKDVETTHEAGQDVYRAAETYVKSDEMDLFDFGKSVSDNRKVTELKNELLSSQEGLGLLKDLKSEDADKVLAAQAEISKKAQEKYGLEPEQVNFYDADKTTSVAMQDNDARDVHGGVVTDDDHELHGEVHVDVSDATTKTELLNTLGHETYESITENTTGEQTAAQEDLAKSFGNQLEDRVNQASGGDLDSTVGDNWNSSLVKSSTAQLGTERVNKVGNANVDYYLTPKQQESKQQELSGCGNDNNCQIDVVRKYDAIDGRQEYEKDKAKLGQIGNNVKDGTTSVVDAVLSPIDTVSGWINSLKGATPESVAEAVNAGADNQHQTLVDKDQAFIDGDSEKLGKAEGDIATDYLSTQSVPGGVRVIGKVVDKVGDIRKEGENLDLSLESSGTNSLDDLNVKNDAKQLVSVGKCTGLFCNGSRISDEGQNADVEIDYSRNQPHHNAEEFVDQAYDQGAGLSDRAAADAVETIDSYAVNGRSKEAAKAIKEFKDENSDFDFDGLDTLHKTDGCIGGDPSCISRAGDSGVNRSLGKQNSNQSAEVKEQLENLEPDKKPVVRVNIKNNVGG